MHDFYLLLAKQIDHLLTKQEFVLVGIDGACGGGKTTLAKLVQNSYAASLIQMDHFFLQPEQRTKKRLATPGGNVDYERFCHEVVPSLKARIPFSYKIYNCQTNTFTDSPEISPSRVMVVEGSYSLHPELRDLYDLKLFVTISPEKQLERLLARNGSKMLKRFKEEWIPLEELYFNACQVEAASDLVFRV